TAARDHDRGRLDAELADGLAGTRGAALGVVVGEDAAGRADDRTAAGQQLVDPVPEPQLRLPALDGLPHRRHERLEDGGAGAQHDVEPRDRVAVPRRGVAPALGPADDREERDALRGEPRSLLAGREGEVRLGPLASPLVLVTVEFGAREPVLSREFVTVADAHPPLLGAVDQEEPAERPPGLAAEGVRRLLFDDDDALPGLDQLRRGDQTRQSGPDHEYIRPLRHPRSSLIT